MKKLYAYKRLYALIGETEKRLFATEKRLFATEKRLFATEKLFKKHL